MKKLGMFCLFVILFSLIFISFIGSDEPSQESVLWKRTASTETYKNNDGTYTTTIFSSAMFIDDETKKNPNYVPFNRVVNMSFDKSSGALIYSYKTIKREYNVSMRIGFVLDITQTVCSNQGWTWLEVGKGYCGLWATDAYSFMKEHNIGSNILITDNTYSFKYGINLTDIPTEYTDKITFIGLRLEEVNGLTWDDVQLDVPNKQILIKDKIILNYNDLLDDGFTLNLWDKKTVLIGNVSNKENLWLDPTIILRDVDTENLEDAYTNVSDPDTNFGSADYIIDECPVGNCRGYIKFNLNELYSISAFNVTDSELSLTNYFGTPIIYIYEINNHTWKEETTTWNNPPLPIGDLINFSTSGIPTSVVEFNVTSWVKNEFNSNDKNVSFMLNYSTNCKIVSKERGSGRPVLEVTYIPYLDIISPIDSQIFEDNIMNYTFNISTAVNMSLCYWTNDSGLTNYSMKNIEDSNTSFYNSTSEFLSDGSHTVKFWCNQSDDGTWRTSEAISFEVDSENITKCRDLTVVREYFLLNNIVTIGDCFDLSSSQGDDIIIDFQGHTIDGDDGTNDDGVNAWVATGWTIKNGIIKDFSDGVLMDKGVGIKIINMTFESNTRGVDYSSTNGVVEAIIVNSTFDSNDIGVRVKDDTNIFTDNVFISSDSFDVQLLGNSVNNTFLNSSHSSEDVPEGTSLLRKWYFLPQVNYTNGTAVNQANITVSNITGNVQTSKLTGVNGQTSILELIEYINDAGTIIYYTNLTINASLNGWVTDSQQINLTTNYLNQQFTLTDTLPPDISIIFPSNNTITSDSLIDVNYTVSDFGSGIDSCWYSNNSGIDNATLSNCANLTTITWNEGIWNVTIYTNDSTNNLNSSSIRFTIDTTPPLLSIISPTNTTNTSDNLIDINYTVSDVNLNTCWYSNNSGGDNATITCGTNLSSITWYDGDWNVTIWANDSVDNQNSSSVSFTIDTTPPNLTIDEPQPKNYANNNTIELNFTVTDLLFYVDSCWYNVRYAYIPGWLILNTTITDCLNTTFELPGGDTDYNITFWANDSVNNINETVVKFGIRTNAPSINLDYPTDNSWFNNETNIYFNFTSTDTDGLSSCRLYGNWTGTFHNNYTWVNPTNATMNWTRRNISEGFYKWNVWCNDSLNVGGFGSSNYSVGIDTTLPNLTLLNSNLTTYNSLSFGVGYNISDLNIDKCYFSLRNSTGSLHNYAENTSLTCSDYSRSLSVLSYGTYTIHIWAEDLADNLNSSVLTFTTQEPSVAPGGGGGGGANFVPVISIEIPSNYTKLISKLNTALIYARIREKCEEVSELIGCYLNLQQKEEVIILLDSQGFSLSIEEFDWFFWNFLINNLIQVDVDEIDADRLNLFKSTLEVIETPFTLSPRNVDSPCLVGFGDDVCGILIKSNKIISAVEIIDAELGFEVSKETETTVRITYALPNLDFTAKNVRATINYVSDGESIFQEVQFRIFHLKSPSFIIGLIVIIGGGILIYVKRKKVKNIFQKIKRRFK